MLVQTPDRVDPITFEVIRNALLEATEEMTIALRRSAYSTNIKTRGGLFLRLFRSRVAVSGAIVRSAHPFGVAG